MGLRGILSSILIFRRVDIESVCLQGRMLINLANTGVRQPHDYKVLRLWSPAPKLLIPSSYFLSPCSLQCTERAHCQAAQLSLFFAFHFPNYSEPPDGAKGGWKCRFYIVNFLLPPTTMFQICESAATRSSKGEFAKSKDKIFPGICL